MTELTAFLREQTLTGANKCRRAPLPPEWSVAEEPVSLPERKALGLKKIFECMPVFIGERERIVGTRTFYRAQEGNEAGTDFFSYHLNAGIPYVTTKEVELFGEDQSYCNKTHYTPDYSILLEKGVGGILKEVEEKEKESGLSRRQREFLSSVRISYTGLQQLILRYAREAEALSEAAQGEERKRLQEICNVCSHIAEGKPRSFYEAVQLLWFGHLGAIIESFEFINYGRLDVILAPFLGSTPRQEALQLLECLLLKMYDQVDITESYLNKYAAQLVVTLGGVHPDGTNAVSEVTMLFLEAVDSVRLPEPEFNLRINRLNPPEFLEKAAELTVSGCNFISYYNDDRWIENLIKAGIRPEDARDYGFDLCQDITIPGKADFYTTGGLSLAESLMDFLKANREFPSFEALLSGWKKVLQCQIRSMTESFNRAQAHVFLYRDGKEEAYFEQIRDKKAPADWCGRSPMSPLPYLSALYHGTIEQAEDLIYESYPVKAKGMMFGTATEAVNSLAAIKKVVYEKKSVLFQKWFLPAKIIIRAGKRKSCAVFCGMLRNGETMTMLQIRLPETFWNSVWTKRYNTKQLPMGSSWEGFISRILFHPGKG